MEALKLTIIIPVYNAEKYLHRCVDSLLAQDLNPEEYEIILVDDGSTDDSARICDEYSEEYSHIKVIHKANGGLSSARNAALDVAIGLYLMFVDADDLVDANAIGSVVEKAVSNGLDACFYKHRVITGTKNLVCDSMPNAFDPEAMYSGPEYIMKGGDVGSIWRCLYRRKLVVEELKEIFYPNITHQDVVFNMEFLPFVDKLMFIDKVVYNYYINDESLTHTYSLKKIEFNTFNDFVVASEVLRFSKTLSNAEIAKLYRRQMNSLMVSTLLRLFRKRKLWDDRFSYKCLKYASDNGSLPIKGRTQSWKTTLLVPIVNWIAKFVLLKNK